VRRLEDEVPFGKNLARVVFENRAVVCA